MVDTTDSIGSITMWPDGTLVFDHRVEGPDGSVGDGRFTIPPTHPDYQRYLSFIGGLKPGEDKPMPRVGPFPDDESAR